MITQEPYVFYRSFSQGDYKDDVVVGLDLPEGEKTLKTSNIFPEGSSVRDAYTGTKSVVKDQKVSLKTSKTIVLLEKIEE